MPRYEFICQDCHKSFEVARPMAEANSTVACPTCGGTHVARTLSPVYAKTAKKS